MQRTSPNTPLHNDVRMLAASDHFRGCFPGLVATRRPGIRGLSAQPEVVVATSLSPVKPAATFCIPVALPPVRFPPSLSSSECKPTRLPPGRLARGGPPRPSSPKRPHQPLRCEATFSALASVSAMRFAVAGQTRTGDLWATATIVFFGLTRCDSRLNSRISWGWMNTATQAASTSA